MAIDDVAAPALENSTVSGNVLLNDYDVDRLDTISVAAVNDTTLDESGSAKITLASGAILTIYSDGSYLYDTNGAFDSLNEGEYALDSFQYTTTDNHGATSTATVSLQINGVSQSLPEYGLGHGYWMNHDGHGPQANDWNIALNTNFDKYFNIDQQWTIGAGKKSLIVDDILFSDAVGMIGGGEHALAREAVTAILNALDEKNGTVYDFQYTADQIVSMVHNAYTSNDSDIIENTKNILAATHI